MCRMKGKLWEAWAPALVDVLVEQQDKGQDGVHPHQKGSWSPEGDAKAKECGRLMMTALAVLSLEVSFGHVVNEGP